MASITRKSTSSKWIACFTDAAGGRCQRSTAIADVGSPSERAEARRRALEVAAEFEAAARGDRTEAQIRRSLTQLYNRVNPQRRLEWATVRPFLTQWIERVEVRKSAGTHKRYQTVIDRFIDGLGPKADSHLGDITTEDVQDFIDRTLGGKKQKRGGTLRLEVKILNAAFTYALRQGLTLTNPVAAAEAPNDGSESKRPFTLGQVRDLLAACDPAKWESGDKIHRRLSDWRTATLIAAFAGLRLGDVTNLRWSNIDLTLKLLRLRPEKTKKRAKDIVVPIHPSIEEHLINLSASDDPAAFVTPTLAGQKIGGRSGLSRQFERIIAKAGIENENIAGGVGKGRRMSALSFHSLKHTYATQLAEAGVPQDMRLVLAGHSGTKVNEIYTHRGLDSLRAAIGKLPGV